MSDNACSRTSSDSLNAPDAMQVIPSIDLLRGQAVKLIGGIPGTGSIIGDPLKTLRYWEAEGARRIHIVDLDAALGQRSNRTLVNRLLVRAKVRTQIGGGIRSLRAARALLDHGADHVMVGTRALNPDWLERAASELRDRLIVSCDALGETVVYQGWTRKSRWTLQEFAREIRHLPLGALLYTNVRVEGRRRGVQWRPVKRLLAVAHHPVIIAGGISSLSDVRRFKRLGVHATIIGSALYAGAFRLRDAQEVAGEW